MRDAGEENVAVSGDPVLLDVLAAAQRFAAWYAEYLSRDAAASPGAGAGATEPESGELITCKLQHAVFDLMAAVHAMNRHCVETGRRHSITTAPRHARVSDDALH
jgi:hypothetical protein